MTATEELLTHMNEAGASTYFDHPPNGTGSTFLFSHMQVDLPTPIASDPRPAVLEWLASVAGSPVRSEEYLPNPDRSGPLDPGGYLAGFVRTAIEGIPFGPGAANQEGFRAMVQANGDVWRILSLTIDPGLLFATREDALKLVECTPAEPPSETSIRASTFEGYEFAYCEPVGAYEYAPSSEDRILWGTAPWGDVPLWQLGRLDAGQNAWAPQIGAQILIAPSNYWDRIAYADCYCGEDHTGYTLVIHAISGEVLRYYPGVNCVVC